MTSVTTKHDSAQASIESEIINLSQRKFRWKTQKNIDLVEDLFDDGLIFIHLNGHVSTKKEWIDELRSGRFVYSKIDTKEVSAKVYGDTAVLVGKAEFTVSMGGGFRSQYHLIYTEVYTKKEGGWKLVNLHTCSY